MPFKVREIQGTGRESCRAERVGVQTYQIRDSFLTDFLRISNILAVNGAKTCVSNKINKRKKPL